MNQPHDLATEEPLHLSVYSLPTPQEAVQDVAPGGRWKLLAIMVVCSLPIIAACFAYFFLRPQGQAALGELIAPVRQMPNTPVANLQGGTQTLEPLKGQWLLVAVAPGACDEDCRQRLFLQRQLREIMGKDKDRVDRVWLVSDQQNPPQDLERPLSDMAVLHAPDSVLRDWLEVPPGKSVTDFLFVVDPLGNTMMRLPARFDSTQANKARRDLERLLRASAPWDGPGRPGDEAKPQGNPG